MSSQSSTPSTGSTRDPPLMPPATMSFQDLPDPITSTPSTPGLQTPEAPQNPFSTPPSVASFSSCTADHSTNASATRPNTARSSRAPSARGSVADLTHSSVSMTRSLSGAEPNNGGIGTGIVGIGGGVVTFRQSVLRNSNAGGGPRESFAAPPKRIAHSRRSSSRPVSSRGRGGDTLGANMRARSTALVGEIEKPWLKRPDSYTRASWWITISFMFLGVAASAVRVYFGYKEVPLIRGNLCLVMEDDFNGPEINTAIWQHEVDLGGFGNGEFEMTTNSPNNSFVKDGVLYLVPTLTRDVIGNAAIFDGHTFNLTGCTNTNASACGAVSNATTRAVINPVQSARITTRNSTSIQYGRVEVRARNPRGDWLWPALWMLPVDNAYGPWPLSGEIDIMEARGNDFAYPRQGRNYVRASLNWGPLSWLNEVSKTFGFWFDRRVGYDEGFHTYALEWTPDFVRMYVDSRLSKMFALQFSEPFFSRGNFPPTVFNGSQEIALTNPWATSKNNAAPFDKPFYLIMDLAVGGTNGWFPDGAGDKPWLDGSNNAMYEFASKTDDWYSTWPQDVTRRALAVDYVKMWQQC